MKENMSQHVASDKIKKILGFEAQKHESYGAMTKQKMQEKINQNAQKRKNDNFRTLSDDATTSR